MENIYLKVMLYFLLRVTKIVLITYLFDFVKKK